MTDILIVGSRGREHALAWSFVKCGYSPIVAPGNPNIEPIAEVAAVSESNADALVGFAIGRDIDITIVCGEIPATKGIANRFLKAGRRIVAATQSAMQLESSKLVAKRAFEAHGLKTERWAIHVDTEGTKSVLDQFGPPWVLKRVAARAGCGVCVTSDRSVAESFVHESFTEPDNQLMTCGFLSGAERTLSCLFLGGTAVRYWETWDYPRLQNGDRGPLTSSMGAVVMPSERLSHLLGTLTAIVRAAGITNSFVELGTIESNGEIFATEINLHLGDPASQAVAVADPQFLVDALVGGDVRPKTLSRCAASIVIADAGYPDKSEPCDAQILIPSTAIAFPGATAKLAGEHLTGFGRVLTICDTDKTPEGAAARLQSITVTGAANHRTDIGFGPAHTESSSYV